MKRDFLKGLELTDDIIDKIMAQYGEDIERYKAEKRNFEERIYNLDKAIRDKDEQINIMRKNDNDFMQLKKDFESLQSAKDKNDNEYKQQIREIKLKSGVEKALNKAGARSQKVILPLLKEFLQKAEIDETGNIKDLDEQIKQIKENEETGFLFKEDVNMIKGKIPGETLNTPVNTTPDFKNMTYEQICETLKNKGTT